MNSKPFFFINSHSAFVFVDSNSCISVAVHKQPHFHINSFLLQ